MRARGEEGFTLVESLIALTILAMTAVALLGAVEAHVARIGALETRALAQIAAENRLAEIALGFGTAAVMTSLLGHEFEVAAERRETSDPGLERIDVTVAEAGGGIVLRGFTGFVDARVLP